MSERKICTDSKENLKARRNIRRQLGLDDKLRPIRQKEVESLAINDPAYLQHTLGTRKRHWADF